MIEITQIVQELTTTAGAWRVAYELMEAFTLQGIPNSVITSRTDLEGSPAHVEVVAPWINHLSAPWPLSYLTHAVVVPLFNLAATSAQRRFKSSVTISHGETLWGDIMVVHAVNAESIARKWRNGEWRWAFNPVHIWITLRDRLAIGGLRFRAYVAVSQRTAEELQQHYSVPAERIHVIPNGVNLRQFKRSAHDRARIRAELGVPDAARLVLFVGNEFKRKGLAPLIEAMQRLGEDVHLAVVGSDNPGPYAAMARAIAQRVHFVGTRRDVAAFYSAADALVLASAYETFALVCVEAMACGTPIFATRVGGIEEYIADGVNGFAIEPTAASIAERLAQAFADPALLERMRAGAVETASRFGWDAAAARYLVLAEAVQREKMGQGRGGTGLAHATKGVTAPR